MIYKKHIIYLETEIIMKILRECSSLAWSLGLNIVENIAFYLSAILLKSPRLIFWCSAEGEF